jgi:hypothetical protein
MKLERMKVLCIAAYVLCLPVFCAVIGFIFGGVIAAFLYAFKVVNELQAKFVCGGLSVASGLIGMWLGARRLRRPVSVVRKHDIEEPLE